MSDRTFKVNSPAVVSEIIDGEVVIMNLKSGNYYSSDKIGCQIWSLVEQGAGEAAIVAATRRAFPEDIDAIETAVAAFLDDLIENELVVEAPTSHDGTATIDAAGGKFRAPQLNVYSDMQDLLLLDPIHDVDDMGWPTPKPAENS